MRRFIVPLLALAIVKAFVTRAVHFAIRIAGTRKAFGGRRIDWVDDGFLFEYARVFGLEISMIASTVLEGRDAPTVWEMIRVGGTAIMTVAPKQQGTGFLIVEETKSTCAVRI